MSRVVSLPRASRAVGDARARMRAPSIAPEVVGEVLAAVGLEVSGRVRDLGGRRSRNVLVPTPAGPKVVKRYRAGWTLETVAVGHSVLVRLEEVGFPALRLVRSASRQTAVVLGEDIYAAFDLLPGRIYASTHLRRPDRLRLMRLAGSTLAGWHAALEGFGPVGRHHAGFVSWEGPRARGLEWYASSVEMLRHDRVGSPRLVGEGPALLERIATLDASLERRDLPRRVIHGDFGLHNLLIDGDVAAPIDVELARIDLRLTDLLLVLDKQLGSGGSLDVQALGAFFDGYGPVSRVEREALADAWSHRCATSAVRSWRSAVGSADPASRVAAAHRSLDLADWVWANPRTVDRLFGPVPAGGPADD